MEEERCPISNPAQPHNLSRQIGVNTESDCYGCGEKDVHRDKDFHYHCASCEVEFHYGCQRFSKKMIHPYHIQHPLTFIPQDDDEFNISDKCSWCGGVPKYGLYHCVICNFSLDMFCFDKRPPLTIKNPKSHQHPLFFFPRPLLVPCDACGSIDVREPSYTCLQCNYMVHKSCIDLPRVIKITRHPHRLYHTPYISPTNPTTLCRICYKTVDIKYGLYSCNLDDCSYVAHAKCATHRNVWDKSELEWEPEEADETEAIKLFKKVGDDLIKHVCHEHNLRFKKHDGVQVVEEQCQVCILGINSHDFYVCIDQCGFFLHEVCAHLPRKLNHALHNHPLLLYPSLVANFKSSCSACSRNSSGFKYICGKKDCFRRNYLEFDVRCILVPEYFTHKSHIQHPIFISTSHDEFDIIFCKACKKQCLGHLQCTVCDFTMCYECATIPDEIYYKFDKHPLFLCYGEIKDGSKYWCEVCEKELDSSKWFYTCDKCCITIHRECLFGSSIYMKYGNTIRHNVFGEFEVVRNNGNTRPICSSCFQRCSDFLYFKNISGSFCSVRCSTGGNSIFRSENIITF